MANRLPVLIAIVFFLLVALVSLGVFERIPHVEDEAAYWFQAQVFAQGRLSVPTPPLAESYWSPFVIDYQGQRFGKYPPGYPLLLSVGMAVGAPWAVNALLGALALWLVADLGRKVYSPITGLLAATLGLTCPVMLAESSSLLSHTASIFLVALFLWAFAGVYQSYQASQSSAAGKWAALAGLALGYLAITRPFDAVGIGLPFALYGLGQVLGPNRRSWLRPLGIAAVVAVLVGLILPLFWYGVTGQVTLNPYRFVYPYDRPGFGPDVGVQGHSLSVALIHLKLNLRALATGFLGWPGYLNIVFLVLPFILQWWMSPRDAASWRRHHTWNYLLLGSFVSVAGIYMTYWFYGGHDAGFPRYYLAALPALLLLTGRGIDLLSLTLRRMGRRISPRAGQLLPVVSLYPALVALVIFNSFVFLPPHLNVFRGKYGVTAAPLQVVEDAGISDTIVFVPDVEHWHQFAVFFAANRPTLDSDVVYAIYYNARQAEAVRGLYPDRGCRILRKEQLFPCAFDDR